MEKTGLVLCFVAVLFCACSDGSKRFVVPPTSDEGRAALKQFREEMRTAGIEGATVTLDDGATGKLHFSDEARWILQSSGGDVEVFLYSPHGTAEGLTVRRAN